MSNTFIQPQELGISPALTVELEEASMGGTLRGYIASSFLHGGKPSVGYPPK